MREHDLEKRNAVTELWPREPMKCAVRPNLGVSFVFESAVRSDVSRCELVVLTHTDISMRVPIYLVHREDKRFAAFQTELVQLILDLAWPNTVRNSSDHKKLSI